MVAAKKIVVARKGHCQGRADRCTAPDCKPKSPKFGGLRRASRDGRRRVTGCGDPTGVGKANRDKGDRQTRKVRKRLGLGGANTRHEEHFGGIIRVEVKAGAQIAPVWTRYRHAEAQSEPHRPHGDLRPFALVCMPDDDRDGVVVIRVSALGDLLSLLNL